MEVPSTQQYLLPNIKYNLSDAYPHTAFGPSRLAPNICTPATRYITYS